MSSCTRASRFVSVVLVRVTLELLMVLMLMGNVRRGDVALAATVMEELIKCSEEVVIELLTERSNATAGVVGLDACCTTMLHRAKTILVALRSAWMRDTGGKTVPK